jgi:hypothetical protein
MKCLTVCQPFASAIVYGAKDFENRNWSTNYRGPMLVHAGMNKSFMHVLKSPRNVELFQSVYMRDLPFGEIIGMVEIVSVHNLEDEFIDSPWATGPFCWKVAKPMVFRKPVPLRGLLGLFEAPESPELLAAIDSAETPAEARKRRDHEYWNNTAGVTLSFGD